MTQGPPSLFANSTWKAGPNGCLSVTVRFFSSATVTLSTCASQLPRFGDSAAKMSIECLTSSAVTVRPLTGGTLWKLRLSRILKLNDRPVDRFRHVL